MEIVVTVQKNINPSSSEILEKSLEGGLFICLFVFFFHNLDIQSYEQVTQKNKQTNKQTPTSFWTPTYNYNSEIHLWTIKQLFSWPKFTSVLTKKLKQVIFHE